MKIEREFIDIPDGSFAITRKGDRVGPIGRKVCGKFTDRAGFYYVSDQRPNGWYTTGEVYEDNPGPDDLVSVAPGSTVTIGAVRTTTKLATTHEVIPGSYGPGKNLSVGNIGTTGQRIAVGVQQGFYTNAELRELATLLNGIADALPEART